VGKREPLGQLPRGLIRSMPVKRHHGRRDPRCAQQLCAPAVADGHDLYEIRPPVDSLFEAVNSHGAIFTRRGTAAILPCGRSRSSEARHEGDVHTAGEMKRQRILPKKNFLWQILNKFCTCNQQLFHDPDAFEAYREPKRGYNEASRRRAVSKRIDFFRCSASRRPVSAWRPRTIYCSAFSSRTASTWSVTASSRALVSVLSFRC